MPAANSNSHLIPALQNKFSRRTRWIFAADSVRRGSGTGASGARSSAPNSQAIEQTHRPHPRTKKIIGRPRRREGNLFLGQKSRRWTDGRRERGRARGSIRSEWRRTRGLIAVLAPAYTNEREEENLRAARALSRQLKTAGKPAVWTAGAAWPPSGCGRPRPKWASLAPPFRTRLDSRMENWQKNLPAGKKLEKGKRKGSRRCANSECRDRTTVSEQLNG